MLLCYCYCYNNVIGLLCYAMLLACGRRWHQVEWIFVRRQSVLQAIQERYYVVWKHFCLSVSSSTPPSPPLILPLHWFCLVMPAIVGLPWNLQTQNRTFWKQHRQVHSSHAIEEIIIILNQRLPNPHIGGATMLSNHVHKCMWLCGSVMPSW